MHFLHAAGLLAMAGTAVMAAPLHNATASTELISSAHGLSHDGDFMTLGLHKRDTIQTYFYSDLIGGNGGNYYEDHFKDNTGSQHNPNWSYGTTGLVKRLTVWWQNDWQGLHGIQVTYTDGTQGPVHGKQEGNQNSLVINPGNKVTELRIWGNGQGTRAGRIRIVLTDGTKFEYGKDNAGDGYNQDISGTSGFLTGIFGRSGDALDCLGMTFIMPISNQRTTNIQFDDNVIGTDTNVDTTSFKNYTFVNNGDTTQTGQSASDSFTFTTSQTWTNQLSLEMGMSYTLKVGVPSVAEESVGATWKTAYTTTNSYTSSSSETFTSNPRCDVPAHSTCQVSVMMTKGTLPQLTYTADVQINVNGWDGWQFKERGVFNTVSYGDIKQVDNIYKNN